jgi:hypothetical protein
MCKSGKREHRNIVREGGGAERATVKRREEEI